MDNGFICICCRRRKGYSEAIIAEKYIGICKNCNEKIFYMPDDAVFMGSENVSSLYAVLRYDGIIKRAIRDYKFYGQQRYSKIFVELMYEYFKNMQLEKEYDLITMIPISRKRWLKRGYNQTEILARNLAERLGIEFKDNCVFKYRHNKAQSSARGISERRENVKNVYIADREKLKGRKIILIDDVYTTGLTMEECAKELKEKGAENVLGIALAKVVK